MVPRDLWRQAAAVRREWLEIGLATQPADRPAAEQALTEIYARHRRPRFCWVPSPRAALPLLSGLPSHDTLRAWVADHRPSGAPPGASDIAAGLSHLRSALAGTYTEPPPDRPPLKRRKTDPWPVLPAAEALTAGVPFAELVRQGVPTASRCRAPGTTRSASAAPAPARPSPTGTAGRWGCRIRRRSRLCRGRDRSPSPGARPRPGPAGRCRGRARAAGPARAGRPARPAGLRSARAA